MTLVFRSTTIHWILCINITTRSVSTVHPSSSVLHILKSPLNLNSPDVTKFSFSTQYCQRNVTTRCNIARLQVEFKYFTSASDRFFMFSEAKGSERALRVGANYRNWNRLSSFVWYIIGGSLWTCLSRGWLSINCQYQIRMFLRQELIVDTV